MNLFSAFPALFYLISLVLDKFNFKVSSLFFLLFSIISGAFLAGAEFNKKGWLK
jgi:hypothetical protein